jgi:putative NADH-flavin reductase
MSKIVVFGATGFAGGQITEELLTRGHSVVGVVRDISKLPTHPELTATAGSAYDVTFVRDVTRGADIIVLAIPSIPPGLPELKDVVPTMLQAAAETGARLAVVGGAGSLASTEGGPLVLDLPEWPAEYLGEAQAHARALDVLRKTTVDADWFYLSPPPLYGSFNPGARTGKYRVGDDVLVSDENGVSQISGADFAIAFVDELEIPKHHRTRFTVAY